MKHYCVSCDEPILNQDEARYELRGNYCERCTDKAGKEARRERAKNAWWNTFYQINPQTDEEPDDIDEEDDLMI